eukprot:TRINITY_DN4607_c0_g1_i2.p1 TRINITY_DN4607_c0_g1~~TRINITY_DN4607_c0_g1_i2.p1  ORF type:complete len:276 (-),score=55.53 TRINITY_DN4607_c0_g1_i2:42-869(-)
MWAHWLPSSVADTVLAAGYYTAEVVPGLRVISLNTDFCDTANIFAVLNQTDHGSQWAWLNETLATAQARGEKVIVIAHIPPGLIDLVPVPNWVNFCVETYNTLMDEYAGVIAIQLFGHLHYDTFRVIRDAAGRPVSTAHVVPALTPRAASSTGLAPPTPGKNPAVRLYHYDTDTFQILDYDQYWADLVAGNEQGELKWELLYSAKDYYGLPDLAPSTFATLAERLRADAETWAAFSDVWFVRRPYDACDAACRLHAACAAAWTDPDAFFECTRHL